jgi:hypothetical protein
MSNNNLWCEKCKSHHHPSEDCLGSFIDWAYSVNQETADKFLVWHKDERKKFALKCFYKAVQAVLAMKCNASGHDDRWCSYCEAKRDTVDYMEQEILKCIEEAK